eukprot:4294061-Pleurochrysis_carterae.AAC.5
MICKLLQSAPLRLIAYTSRDCYCRHAELLFFLSISDVAVHLLAAGQIHATADTIASAIFIHGAAICQPYSCTPSPAQPAAALHFLAPIRGGPCLA